MKKINAAEKLYEIENLMRTIVGLQEDLDDAQTDALVVDMRMLAMPSGENTMGMRICCESFEFYAEGIDFDSMLERAHEEGHNALERTRKELQPRERPGHLKLVPSPTLP